MPFPTNALVILKDTEQHGVVIIQKSNGTYKIRVTGRPARSAQPDKRGRGPIPARAKAPDFDRDDTLEEVMAHRAGGEELSTANFLVRQNDVRGVRQTPAARDELRFFSEDIVDSDGSTDHQIDEAQRHLDALDQVEAEDL